MSTTYVFEKVSELKDKFKNFFIQRKKLRALENYSQVAPFQHKEYLSLLKRCMDDGFLGEREADFISYMMERYEVNFLDWAHRTKWLKGEMQRMRAVHNKDKIDLQSTIFDFLKPRTPNVPAEVLAQHTSTTYARRAV